MSTATLVHRYEPSGAAKELFLARDAEVLLSGPAGTGKSRAALEKLHMMALANPRMRGLIVRKTLASLGSTALVTWREHVATEALAAGIVKYYGGSSEQSASYRYTNGSIIGVGGMDKATRVMSSEYDVVYVQEAIELTENDWESISTRLRNGKISFQQIIADTNPDTPTHWLKQRCDRGTTRVLESRHEDNPTLFRGGDLTDIGTAYIGKLDALTGVRYQRLRRGLWVAAEGLIFEEWDPAVHLVDWFEPPKEWTRWWAVDFGYVHPFVLQCWAEDPDGGLWLYREIVHTKRLVEDHAKQIIKLVTDKDGNWTEPRPRAVICDHDAEDRATLERHLGMSTTPAHKGVSDGLQAMQVRLRPAGTANARLHVMRNCVVERDPEMVEAKKPIGFAEEIVGYIWAHGNGRNTKEAPVKEHDDSMDPGRYVVAEIDLGSRPRVRFM